MGRGFGIEASVPVDVVKQVAVEAEALGYSSFWVNHPPGSDALQSLAAAASVTSKIKLGVGVIPIDRHPVSEVVATAIRHALPEDRLLLGICPGGDPNGLDLMRRGVERLRSSIDTTIIMAALGPRMMRLCGEIADGVLINWATPEFEHQAGEQIRTEATRVGRPRPLILSYVRCGLLPGAQARLDERSARYATVPQYARHFRKMGVSAADTYVSGYDAATLQSRIEEHERVLDETIVRAITPDDSVAAILELMHACAKPRGETSSGH